jgi:twitching motility two-component system response regulator PilG
MDAAHVVVIDDSPTICKIIETCLHRAGYRVTSFQDPVLALLALLVPGATAFPAILFVDIRLPRIDGYNVIKRLRSHPAYTQTPIIAISEHGSALDRLKMRLAGANTYVKKPFRTQEIVALVQRYTLQHNN